MSRDLSKIKSKGNFVSLCIITAKALKWYTIRLTAISSKNALNYLL